jgi:hypothetical protein
MTQTRMIFEDLPNKIAPTRLQGYAQTIPSQPKPSTPSAPSNNSVKTSVPSPPPAQVSQLNETDWQGWNHSTPATAEQLERLQQWLKPLPVTLIQLKQLLENQQQSISHVNMVVSNLTALYQEKLTTPLKMEWNSPIQKRKDLNWSAIAIVSSATVITIALMAGLILLNAKVDSLLARTSRLEQLVGGKQQ